MLDGCDCVKGRGRLMLSVATSLYTRSPVWLQNLLISAYGLSLQRLRYGPVGDATLEKLRESARLSAAEVERRQLRMLSDVVARAAANVPFYQSRALKTREFSSLDQLRQLPLLDKSDVQRAGRSMISDAFRKRSLQEIHTGGTTGKPLAIYCDRATLQRHYAFFTQFKASAGIGPHARTATFAGRTLAPANSGPPYWRFNRAANTLLCSSYHISAQSIPLYAAALADFDPELIDSYPSSIEPIARYIVRNGLASVRPRAVITSSETLFPEVRQIIEQAFGCKVFDHYGSAEMAALITQCREGCYHVESEYGIVELLEEARPVDPGERGEIVATGFINPVMPLIRYRMGDYAVRARSECRCGRPGLSIERIEGRIDDVVVTPEGNMVGRLDPIFKSVASLSETRIVQDAVDHLTVELVASDAFTPAMEHELESQLRARVGTTMRIDFVRVPAIERTARGKLRTTVNLVHRQSRRSIQSATPQ
jgi:phenylacetate-CoA ligase